MSKKLDINEYEVWVLTLFSEGYDRGYYIRELSTCLPISHGTAQTILGRLEKKQILSSSLRGKTRIFRIKSGEIAVQYFVLAEQYKKIAFMEEKPYLSEVLQKIDHVTKGITLVFGSYAKGTGTGDSDLDILVAGRCDEKEISRMGKMYDVGINIRAFPKDVFENIDQRDTFFGEVKKHHILWKNADRFVRAVIV